EVPAEWLGPVILGIRNRGSAEDLLPASPTMQTVGIVDRVSGLVAQNPHAPGPRAPFDLQHLAVLDAHQSRMRQIERNPNARHAVRAEPLRGQPAVRPEADSAPFQFVVKLHDPALQRRPLDLQSQIAQAQIQQLPVGQRRPVQPAYARRVPNRPRSLESCLSPRPCHVLLGSPATNVSTLSPVQSYHLPAPAPRPIRPGFEAAKRHPKRSVYEPRGSGFEPENHQPAHSL